MSAGGTVRDAERVAAMRPTRDRGTGPWSSSSVRVQRTDTCDSQRWEVIASWEIPNYSQLSQLLLFFFKDFIYLFMRDAQREAETQAEEEADSLRRA